MGSARVAVVVVVVVAVAAVAGCTYDRVDLPDVQVGGVIDVLTPNPVLADGQSSAHVRVRLLAVSLGSIEGATVSVQASMPQAPGAGPVITPGEVTIGADGMSEVVTVTSKDPGVAAVHASVSGWEIELAPVLLRFTADPMETVLTAAPYTVTSGAGPVALAVGDIDGDGLPDVVTADLSSSSVSVLRGDGRGHLAPGARLDASFAPRDIALADVDHDGDTDILYVTPSDPHLGAFIQGVDGGMSRTLEGSRGYPRALAVVELGAASSVDIVVIAANDHELLHYPAASTRLGGDFIRHPSVGLGPAALATGDLDGDGFDAVVVANVGSNDLTLLPDAKDLDAASRLATVQAPTALALADVDGDGALDIVATGTGPPAELGIHLQRYNGYERPPLRRPLCRLATAVTVGDLNRDGFPDIAVACGADRALRVFLGDDHTAGEDVDGAYSSYGDIAVPGWPMDLVLADLDGDDILDIIFADFEGSAVTVLRGRDAPLSAGL